MNFNVISNNANIALGTLWKSVENNPNTAAAVSFASALGIAGATYSIYRSTQKSKPTLEKSADVKADPSQEEILGDFLNMIEIQEQKKQLQDIQDKAEHTTKINTVLSELKTQVSKKNHATKFNPVLKELKIQHRKKNNPFRKLGLFIKNGIKSMIKALSKFGRFAFKTLPSRVYKAIFRKSLIENFKKNRAAKKIQQLYRANKRKTEHATEFKPVLTELEKEIKATRKVRFDEQGLNQTTVLGPRVGA